MQILPCLRFYCVHRAEFMFHVIRFRKQHNFNLTIHLAYQKLYCFEIKNIREKTKIVLKKCMVNKNGSRPVSGTRRRTQLPCAIVFYVCC